MDSIITGFEKCFPETGINTYQGLSSMDIGLLKSRGEKRGSEKYCID
jgi:hypothetical protein